MNLIYTYEDMLGGNIVSRPCWKWLELMCLASFVSIYNSSNSQLTIFAICRIKSDFENFSCFNRIEAEYLITFALKKKKTLVKVGEECSRGMWIENKLKDWLSSKLRHLHKCCTHMHLLLIDPSPDVGVIKCLTYAKISETRIKKTE